MGDLIYFFFDSNISIDRWYNDGVLLAMADRPIEDFIAAKEIANKYYEHEIKIRDLCSEWRKAEGYSKPKILAILIRVSRFICPLINKAKIAALKEEIKELENARPDEWKEIIEPFVTETAKNFKSRYKTKDCEAALYAYASVYSRINEINKYADMWMPKNT